ncbi:MAG: ribosomal protein S18-alanine N-acetyltransferase [Erysipelotrichaceae bacterium]
MIEQMQEKDLIEVTSLEDQVLHGRWDYDQFLYELQQNEFAHLNVIRNDEELIGFIDYWITFEVCQLASLAIHPKFQRLGYARAFMQDMEIKAANEKCESVQLEVRITNDKAINFYKSLGYFQINIRKNYYGDTHEDAIVMAKSLEVK